MSINIQCHILYDCRYTVDHLTLFVQKDDTMQEVLQGVLTSMTASNSLNLPNAILLRKAFDNLARHGKAQGMSVGANAFCCLRSTHQSPIPRLGTPNQCHFDVLQMELPAAQTSSAATGVLLDRHGPEHRHRTVPQTSWRITLTV